jgi:putative Mn2+ efflux pump MntP
MWLGTADILLIGVGLSMDAFAVAVCKGLAMRKINWGHAGVIALFFGGFQALMPFLGWLLGLSLQGLISAYDHWIAFGLLLFIGGKFLYDALKGDDCEGDTCDISLDIKGLTMLAIATSIDALAIGVTLAFLKVNVAAACGMIGVTTFLISFGGVAVGNFFGARFQKKAEIAGGVILILIGLKILLEHVGIL